jgi:uncharacterized protein
VGLPTLNDILAELAKPGRDPRERFEAFQFAAGIEKIDDLRAGMVLPGIVTNLTAFGAFVDIGVHQDGLVHLSQIADRYVKDPAAVLKVRQPVEVTVLAVDLERKRISLTLKKQPAANEKPGAARGERGQREGRAADEPARPITPPVRDKSTRNGPARPGKPRDEKVPFNNPFAAVFGKK